MSWILIYITLGLNGPVAISMSEPWDTMEGCFEDRDYLVDAIGRPLINYQVLCIQDRRKDDGNTG